MDIFASKRTSIVLLAVSALLVWLVAACVPQVVEEDRHAQLQRECLKAGEAGRVVCADIAAIDQSLVYNRFGSFNPFGMIFALDRDLVPLKEAAATSDGSNAIVLSAEDAEELSAERCASRLGTETRAADVALKCRPGPAQGLRTATPHGSAGQCRRYAAGPRAQSFA